MTSSEPAALFAEAREQLAGAPREALGKLVVPSGLRKVLGGRPRIVPDGEAWRVGVLLIAADAVYEVGEVLRAAEERRRGFTADASRRRAEAEAMCVRGGFAAGTVVNVDITPVDLDRLAAGRDAGPLVWREGRVLIRWAPSGALMPLDAYLRERVAMLRG